MADIAALMPGTIIDILVKIGEKVMEGQEVILLESMKMENPICTPCIGTVKVLKVETGDTVVTDQVLMTVE